MIEDDWARWQSTFVVVGVLRGGLKRDVMICNSS